MKVWIMRHGQAEHLAARDEERALTHHGEDQARATGKWLAEHGVEQPRIVASPYRRAQQTAAGVAKQLGTKTVETLDLLTPDGDPRRVCRWLEEQPAGELILVTHMPLVGQLTQWLLEGVQGAGEAFATAEIKALKFEEIGPGLAHRGKHFSPH